MKRNDLSHPASRAPRPGGALLAAGAAALLGGGWGCAGRATGPSPIRDLPAALTLRVGEEQTLTPTVDRQYRYEWASSAPGVAAVTPSMGYCEGTVVVRCREGDGVTASVRALAPGQATVRVWAPDGQGTRTGHTAAVVVTVQPAAP